MKLIIKTLVVGLGTIIASSALAQTSTLPRSVTSVTGTGAYVTVPAGNGAGDSEPFPVQCISGCTASGTQDTNWIQTLGTAVATGVGASGVNTPKVGIASDSTLTSVGTVTAVTAVTTVGTITNPVGVKGVDGSTIASATNTVPVSQAATAATSGLLGQQCTAACASSIVSGAHNLYAFNGSSTVSGWFLVYDATTCSVDGTVTPARAIAYQVPGATISASWGVIPKPFATGIAICFSTTGPYTATASTTAFVGIDYK